jgi:tetratricopeptide (TPR) repeat protein
MSTFHQEHQKVDFQINIGSIVLQVHATENVAAMLGKAVRLLHTTHYDEALQLLDKVILADEEIPDAYYYRALAALRGKRPKSTLLTAADKMCRDLTAAIRIDADQAHYYYLLALVQYDFYIMNGFRCDEDEIERMLHIAASLPLDIARCEEMLRHTNNPDSPIIDFLQQRL